MALFFYKEKNKDIRAAAYLRLSIEDGDKAESNSIGNQRELIRDFAAERPGLHLVEEYADDGYTGTNFERPGFKRMIFYLLGSVLLATAILSYLMHQSQGMEALQMLIGGFVIFMIPQVVGGVVVLLELAAVMLRQVWYI